LNASEVAEAGLLGDRSMALIDTATGKVASAKNPTKWGKLFDCRAAFTTAPRSNEKLPPVRITLPDGRMLNSDHKDVDSVLSEVFARSVKLMNSPTTPPVLEEYWPDVEGLAFKETITDESMASASPPGSFFDYGVLHLLTTATLEKLRLLYPEGRFETRRFRPNIVVQTDSQEKSFAENQWVGKQLKIGDELTIEVTDPCARCVMITLPQSDLPADSGILRTAAQHNKVIGGKAAGPDGAYPASVGVYARVLKSGTIHRGDRIAFA
jgi:uncharacterized protein